MRVFIHKGDIFDNIIVVVLWLWIDIYINYDFFVFAMFYIFYIFIWFPQESLLKQDSDHQVAIEQLTAKLSFTGDENIKLRQNLTEVTQRSDKDCHGFKQQLGEREQLYKQLETAVSELRVELMGVKVERDEFEGRLVAGKVTGDVTVDLQRQNSDLRSKQAQLETDSHKEIAKQQSKVNKVIAKQQSKVNIVIAKQQSKGKQSDR